MTWKTLLYFGLAMTIAGLATIYIAVYLTPWERVSVAEGPVAAIHNSTGGPLRYLDEAGRLITIVEPGEEVHVRHTEVQSYSNPKPHYEVIARSGPRS